MYIDSNIFIFAATDAGKKGKNCRKIIEKIDKKEIFCSSSYLVIDEVIWILKKKFNKKFAIKLIKEISSLPIKWIDVNKSVVVKMIDIIEKTKLDPRDAVHLASMKENGISTILSEDNDFNQISGINKLNSSTFFEKI